MCEENWKPVVGYEGYYSVSDLGRVRRDAGGKGARAGVILRAYVNHHGYSCLNLCREGIPRVVQGVHRLVMAAFVGPRPQGMDINHRNGIKSDNRLGNLEYVTRAGNVRHAYDHDLIPQGSRHCWAKLTEADVTRIRQALAEGQCLSAIARQFNVTRRNIAAIRDGRSWKRVA